MGPLYDSNWRKKKKSFTFENVSNENIVKDIINFIS